MTEPIITADDVVRAGACAEGVAKFCQRFHKQLAAAMPVSLALLLTSESESERGYVMQAAYDGDDYGDGHGDGYGFGRGSGNGYGNGSGNGYGHGDGYGHGWGQGNGYGYGHGDGGGGP